VKQLRDGVDVAGGDRLKQRVEELVGVGHRRSLYGGSRLHSPRR
jgi:hypothetical protein